MFGKESAVAHLAALEADPQTFNAGRGFQDLAHGGTRCYSGTHLHGADAHGVRDIAAGIATGDNKSVESRAFDERSSNAAQRCAGF